jgi:hypothetical protein
LVIWTILVVTWTILAAIDWRFLPYALLGLHSLPVVGDWLHGPYCPPSFGEKCQTLPARTNPARSRVASSRRPEQKPPRRPSSSLAAPPAFGGLQQPFQQQPFQQRPFQPQPSQLLLCRRQSTRVCSSPSSGYSGALAGGGLLGLGLLLPPHPFSLPPPRGVLLTRALDAAPRRGTASRSPAARRQPAHHHRPQQQRRRCLVRCCCCRQLCWMRR